MIEQQPKCILIADEQDEDECNNKITHLRSQRFCERKAKLCAQSCEVCQRHGEEYLKKDHRIITVKDFNQYFLSLQQTCGQQTQHYIRQINEAQRNAVEIIAKKKEEHLKQIDEIKVHMMKRTYKTLEDKYPTLYEKYRNERIDKLTCCQVFWVINALPTHHNIKHSEINKKLQAILKKFQNFKQVTRNSGGQNIFKTKVRAKKGKISDKLAMMEPIIVDNGQVGLDKFDLLRQRQENHKREISKLSQELVRLKDKKLDYEREVRKVEHELNFLTKMKELKKQKANLTIISNTLSFKLEIQPKQGSKLIESKEQEKMQEEENIPENIQYSISSGARRESVELRNSSIIPQANVDNMNQSNRSNFVGNAENDEQNCEEPEKSLVSGKENNVVIEKQPIRASENIPPNNESSHQQVHQNESKKSSVINQSIFSDKRKEPSEKQVEKKPSEHAEQLSSHNTAKMRLGCTLASELREIMPPPSEHSNNLQESKNISQQQKQKSIEKSKSHNEEHDESKFNYLIDNSSFSVPSNRAGQIKPTKSYEIFPISVSSIAPSASQRSQLNQIVKIEEKEPFVPWKNKQLVQKLKKSGKKAENALKVEDIDALSRRPFMKPPPNYPKGKAESIRSSQGSELNKKSVPASPEKLSDMVSKLFSQYEQKKKSSSKDPPKKK